MLFRSNGSTGDAWCWGDRGLGQVGDGVVAANSPILAPYYFGVSFRPLGFLPATLETAPL